MIHGLITHIRIILVEMLERSFELFQLGRRDIGMCGRHHLLCVSLDLSRLAKDRTAHLILHKRNLLPDVRLGQLKLILEIIERQDGIIVFFDFGFQAAPIDCENLIGELGLEFR